MCLNMKFKKINETITSDCVLNFSPKSLSILANFDLAESYFYPSVFLMKLICCGDLSTPNDVLDSTQLMESDHVKHGCWMPSAQ